ncbi:MAG: adenylate/guanylate cyclase domain-containing protein [Dehalococcoidia bacterium]
MPYPEFHYRWRWDLDSSPESIWPYVSDTNRFNRETGVPVLTQPADNGARRDGRRRLRLSRFGTSIEWDEEPFEWVRPYRFGVLRRYTKGPLRSMRILVELELLPNAGTRVIYQVRAQASNPLGLASIPIQIGLLNARRFERAVRRYDRLARSGTPFLTADAQPELAEGGRRRLWALLTTLQHEGADPALAARLADTVERTDEVAAARLRPYALADAWGVPRRPVLELCLLATRTGLLDAQWDAVCPLCRGAKQRSLGLAEVQSQVHCESCNIDFSVDLDRALELTFRPNSAIRSIDVGEYCIGGPQVTPHIVLQQRLRPGEDRLLTPVLEEGRYRLRIFGEAGGQFFRVVASGAGEHIAVFQPAGWPAGEPEIFPAPRLRLVNLTSREQLFILERTTWSDQAAVAAEVTTLQRFRDLFARESLRPGERLSVGSLAVVFTDLRGSTRLYRQIGDAPAFGLVLNHFDVLRDTIAAEGGTIVKTIGDAVMAVFRRPVGAIRAMLTTQRALAEPSAGLQPLKLKAGIHYGPCLAVTLNDRLDYFGSTVNAAARLEGQSSGEDIVVSETVYSDPEVAELLDAAAGLVVAEQFDVELKGFDEDRFRLWRVRIGGGAELVGDSRDWFGDARGPMGV